MIRESLNANSRQAMTNLTAVNGWRVPRRTSTAVPPRRVGFRFVRPYWVRLVRSGNTSPPTVSSDGVDLDLGWLRDHPMSSNVYIGLLVCSHVNGTLCTSTIDNVTANP